jgi:hypothetical protein
MNAYIAKKNRRDEMAEGSLCRGVGPKITERWMNDSISASAAKSYNDKRSLKKWRILACLPKFIGRNFLFKRYKASSIKGGSFMRTFGSSTVLASSVVRAITNHTPTGEFQSSFFLI